MGGMNCASSGYRLISTPISMGRSRAVSRPLTGSVKRIAEGDSERARLAELHILLAREVRRYVAEVEATHGIAPVGHVTDPYVGGPGIALVPGLCVQEDMRSRGVRIQRGHVIVEAALASDIQAHEIARTPRKGREGGRLPARCVWQSPIR